MICDVNIRDDHADFHKGLIPAEKPKSNQIMDTCLLKVGQIFCVVHMSLRIQIPVTDFNWMKEFVIAHEVIIQSLLDALDSVNIAVIVAVKAS